MQQLRVRERLELKQLVAHRCGHAGRSFSQRRLGGDQLRKQQVVSSRAWRTISLKAGPISPAFASTCASPITLISSAAIRAPVSGRKSSDIYVRLLVCR